MTELIGSNISLYQRLFNVDFSLARGELVAIVGPNGSGKTSLLRILAGLREPDQGVLRLGGKPQKDMTPLMRAHHRAYLPQRTEIAWPISVVDMVRLGRFSYGDSFSTQDIDIVANCLDEVGASHLTQRSTTTLSGGELALCSLARVFAANTPVMLLDEPTAALDPRRQIEIMERLVKRTREGQGIAVVLHDLNLAAQFADRVVWMNHGRIAAESGTEAADLVANIAAIFKVSVHIETNDQRRVTSLGVAHRR